MEIFDLIVIGGGPGGYLAAERAGHAGLKTMVIEKRAFGGVCLNEGCVPSKTFLNSAKVFDYANHANAYGVNIDGKATVDQKFVVERKNGVVKMLVSGVKGQLKRNHVVMKETEGFIDFVMGITGVEVGACVMETAKDKFKISLRSKGADVNAVAGTFGGGGHTLASGCQIQGEYEEVVDKVRYAVIQHLPD